MKNILQRIQRYSIAEISIGIIVLGIVITSLLPIYQRMMAKSRNVQRITDVKTIAGHANTYKQSFGRYPKTLSELKGSGIGEIPTDPSKLKYCTGVEGYEPGDYQYFACENCTAIGPEQSHFLPELVQVGALMEREVRRGRNNAGNRWSTYQLNEPSDCFGNATRGAGTRIENFVGNRAGGLDLNVTQIPTTKDENHSPRYITIVAY